MHQPDADLSAPDAQVRIDPDPPDATPACDAQSVGPLFARVATPNSNAGGELDWQEPNNALQNDGKRSTAATVFPGDSPSVRLAFIDFSQSDQKIPTSAKQILGIKVEVIGHANVPNIFHDGNLYMRRTDVADIISANHSVEQPGAWPGGGADDVTHTFGGPTARWELAEALTPSLLRNPNFAIVYGVARNSGTGPQFYLNAVQMTVFYCE